MRKAVNVLIECPFFISCADRYIICEGIIDGTRDKHFLKLLLKRIGTKKMSVHRTVAKPVYITRGLMSCMKKG